MANLRRSIYIGIGGTGVKAIAYTKKMFEEAFGVGNIPQHIQFLAIDSDFAALYDSLHPSGISECAVRLKTDVRLPDVYMLQKHLGRINWMFPENVRLILPRLGLGAGQVRTNGRLFIELCMSEVLDGIRHRYNRVMNAPINHWGSVDIHIVCSLAGGTGSGAFIPLACMIRNMYGNGVNIFGYGLMDGVFRAMDVTGAQTPNVRINTYAAVLDLDYFQSATGSRPVKMSIVGHDIVITAPLFDRYFLWDNKSENGFMLTSLDELCRMMASALYIYGAEAGAEINLRLHTCDWKYGTYNIYDKMGWVQRLGLCQVVYDGERLAGLYAQKAKLELIRQYLSGGSDVDQMVADWCESNSLGASETHVGLIDAIFSPAELGNIKYPNLDIEALYEEMSVDIGKYIENYQNLPTKESLLNLRERILESLNAKVAEILNGVGGVADAQAFLTALARTCAGYKNEMEAEREYFINSVLREELALDVACKEYQYYRGRVFKTKNGMRERLYNITCQAKVFLVAKVEVRRREEVCEILSALENEIERALEKVMNIYASLNLLGETYTADFIQRQNIRLWSFNYFEYDLSVNECLNMTLGENEISLTDFMSSLTKPFAELTKEEIDLAFDAFTASLPRCEQYRATLINDVIQNLSPEDYMKLREVVAQKISPFLPLKYNCPENMMASKICAVSIYRNYSEGRSRMENDSWSFERGIDCRFIPSDAPEMRQKVVFFRIDSAVIPYCLKAFDESVEDEYYSCLSATQENSRFNPHIDLHIYEDMKRKDFKLKPEHPDESMFYWACGQIFGWPEAQRYVAEVGYPEKYICYMHQRYMFWNPNLAQGGGWHEFHSSNRVRAFEYFKTELLPYLRDDYVELISQKISERGMIYYRHLIDSLRSGGKQRYVETVLHETPRMPMEDDVSFIDEEWTYIEEKLVDTLQLTKL